MLSIIPEGLLHFGPGWMNPLVGAFLLIVSCMRTTKLSTGALYFVPTSWNVREKERQTNIQRQTDRQTETEKCGSHGSRTFPRTFPPEKNANNVVEIKAGMIKQYFLSRSWIDETIRC